MTTAMIPTDQNALHREIIFNFDDDEMPIYLGETEEELAEDWDSVNESLTKDHWKLAAIAAKVVSKYGENNVGTFAYDHKVSSSWIRGLARTYRAFQYRKRFSNLSFQHYYEAAKAKNPVKAAKIAHDREMSTRELKRWIYMGEGRHSRHLADKTPDALPGPDEKPIEIVVEAEDPDDEEGVTIEDELIDEEDRADMLADLALGLRLCTAAIAHAKTRYVLRYFESLQQELDWEIEQLTKLPSAMSERVEALIRGGCWIPDQIITRAKLSSVSELNRICQSLEKAGKIKWSREGKRKHGTAPELWMPTDMPDGGDFEIRHQGHRSDIEYDEDHIRHG